MLRFTRWVVAHTVKDWEDVRNPDVRGRYGVLEGWFSILGNLLLALAKGALGVGLSSAGLIADAVHSLSDMASSIVVIISFRATNKPPDREHPFGHAKAEYVATLVVALLMIMAGFQIGQESVGSLLGPPTVADPLTWPLFVGLVALVVAKELMAKFSNALGAMIGSATLTADGWHHRTDALSTSIVILGLAGRNIGLYWLDGAAGLLVGAYIIYIGVRLAYDAISPLLGEMVPTEHLEEMRRIVDGVPGVLSSHDLAVHQYGHYYFTTVHVEVSDRLDVHKMHEISVVVETRILKRFPGECVVHVDPVNLHHPLLNRVADALRDTVLANPDLVEFRDLNLANEDGREVGHVELAVEPETDEARYPAIAGDVERRITERFPSLEFHVHLKVDYTAASLTA